jgi:hypothetical protein
VDIPKEDNIGKLAIEVLTEIAQNTNQVVEARIEAVRLLLAFAYGTKY